MTFEKESELRKKIFEAILTLVRALILTGVGLFIAFVGLKDSGIVAADPSTYVKLAPFNILFGNVAWKKEL